VAEISAVEKIVAEMLVGTSGKRRHEK